MATEVENTESPKTFVELMEVETNVFVQRWDYYPDVLEISSDLVPECLEHFMADSLNIIARISHDGLLVDILIREGKELPPRTLRGHFNDPKDYTEDRFYPKSEN